MNWPVTPEWIMARVVIDDAGCWLWNGYTTRLGYGQICFTDKKRSAHRVSWVAFRGPIPDGKHVLHHCDVRRCVNPEHLWLGTHQDNMTDMRLKGRVGISTVPKGETHHLAKLTDAQALLIRASRARACILAKTFGVSHSVVSAIRRGKAWSHLPKQANP